MCFTKEITAGLMVFCGIAGATMQMRGFGIRQYQLFYVFCLMEAIQLVQHLTLDDCSSWMNRLATLLAWIHVSFQPVSVNYFAFGWEPNTDVVKAIIRICIASGCFMVMRAPGTGLAALLHKAFPMLGTEFPDPALAGSSLACSYESMCGPQLCARTGVAHLRWEIPLMPTTYLVPGTFMHFFLFHIPAMVTPGVMHGPRIILASLLMLLGPFLTFVITVRAAGVPGYRQEWPGFWCLYSPVLVMAVIVYDVCAKVQDARIPGTAANLRYRQLVKAGRLFCQAPLLAATNGRKDK